MYNYFRCFRTKILRVLYTCTVHVHVVCTVHYSILHTSSKVRKYFRKYDKKNKGRFRYLNILITFLTASHTHRAQYIFLRLEYFFTRSRRNGARKRAIASADSRSRKPRRLKFHSIQWNARTTSLPSILSPRARHDRGAVPRRGANAGVQPCDAVISASWKIFKYRNLPTVQYVLFVVLSYESNNLLPCVISM